MMAAKTMAEESTIAVIWAASKLSLVEEPPVSSEGVGSGVGPGDGDGSGVGVGDGSGEGSGVGVGVGGGLGLTSTGTGVGEGLIAGDSGVVDAVGEEMETPVGASAETPKLTLLVS